MSNANRLLPAHPRLQSMLCLIAVLFFCDVTPCSSILSEAYWLEGLESVSITVERIDQDLVRVGVTESRIKTVVKKRLQEAGITVREERAPYLYISIANVEVRDDSRTAETRHAFVVRMQLKEWAETERGPAGVVSTWGAVGVIGVSSVRTIGKTIREVVWEMVNEFIIDHFMASIERSGGATDAPMLSPNNPPADEWMFLEDPAGSTVSRFMSQMKITRVPCPENFPKLIDRVGSHAEILSTYLYCGKVAGDASSFESDVDEFFPGILGYSPWMDVDGVRVRFTDVRVDGIPYGVTVGRNVESSTWPDDINVFVLTKPR